jgi:hypothetical protein
MVSFEEFLAGKEDEEAVDVSGIGAVPIETLKELVPTQEEAGVAAAAAAAPGALTEERRLETVPGLSFDDFIASEDEPFESRTLDKEGQRFATQLALGTGLTIATGGLGLPARVAASTVIPGAVDIAQRTLQGEPLGEAVKEGAITGGVIGAAEAATPIPGAVAGSIIRGVRSVARPIRQGIRRARGVAPIAEIPRITSTAKPFQDFLEEGAEEAFEDVTQLGGVPLPGQLVEHNLIDTSQNIAGAGIASGQTVRAQKEQGVKLVQNHIVETVENMPQMSRREVADLVTDLAEGRLSRIKGVAHGVYRRADRLLKDASVDIRLLKKAYQQEAKAAAGGAGNPKIRKMAKLLSNKPDTLPYADAQRLRSDLFELSQEANPQRLRVMSQSQRVANRGRNLLTRSMRESAKKASPEARALLDHANQLWREEVRGTLTSRTLQQLIRKQPEDMLDAIIMSGKPGTIRMIHDIVAKENPAVWTAVQGAFLKRVLFLSSAKDPVFVGGQAVMRPGGNEMLQRIAGFGKQDEAALNALFPGESKAILNNIRRHANTLKLMEKKAGGPTTGAVWFNLGQAGAIGAFAGGATLALGGGGWPSLGAGVGVTAAMFLLTPAAIARMYRNPEMVKWLTIGASHAPGTRPAAKASLVMAGLLLKERMLNDEQSERAIEFIANKGEELKAFGSAK